MTPLWFLVVQALASVAQVATIVFLVLQVRFARAQVLAAHENIRSQQEELSKQTTAAIKASQGSNLFEVTKYLESPDLILARRIVNSLSEKPFENWTEDEKHAADLVWRVWTHAPIWQRMGLVPPSYLEYYYGATIVRHWRILEPFILDLRHRRAESQLAVEFEDTAREIEDLGWFKGGKDARPKDRYAFFQAS
jgi:hypothetical protein